MKKVLLILLIILTACSNPHTDKEDLVIYSPYPERFIQPVVQDFEHETGQRVRIIHDSTRKLIKKVEQTPMEERGHVFVGGSLSELKDSSSIIQGEIKAFIYMPSVFIVNKDLIGDIKVDKYRDLLKKDLYKQFSYPNPELTNTGYQHRSALETIYNQSQSEKILKRGVQLNKTADVMEHVISGRSYVGLTYEYAAMDYIDKGYPLKIIYPSDGTIINTDGIVKINDHPKSEAFIQYMLSKHVQQHISTTFHVKPIHKEIQHTPYKVLKPLNEINVIQKGGAL